ncbi:peptide-methionine (S)-S-oxide reductase MsrA [Glaciimonas immobilis]|uniref:Peptide methionine sulfoxide reductase MsrA n=1 Tax=Glaciimonas immobilis TaxID=728004 RepID=A0A840RPI1_9BURK|nr:peptide-methionine (S)-S-oxide reductase MsrA [Glaciimonas immobilis]KAF3996826.1 peptide-methionine (S)-S-oxide reductase MsrA [Glaciimonas immobilis]MBB5199625.1 peptide-methionine (S)-S-oxide reductase [Glaciimonas immobilis]
MNISHSRYAAPVVRILSTLLIGVAVVTGSVGPVCAYAAESAVIIAAPTVNQAKIKGPLQIAVFAGGCFWGVQGVFEHVRGVRKVVSGYSGGDKNSAQYDTVSTGKTGHAESVQITFDPAEVTYGELLQVFFSVTQDPTQLNRQGPDSGTQYRSNIFYVDDAQKNIAQAYIAQLTKAHAFSGSIVTRIDPLKSFYPAEAYHQDFLLHNPTFPYIVYNDLPKIENLKKVFPKLYTSVAVASGY